jgi:hypothetical protein
MTKAITAAVAFIGASLAFAGPTPPADDFPIAELQYKDSSRLFHLHNPYGFVARWEDGKGNFYLYDKGRTNITTTGDLETFIGELSSLPDGAEIAWVNTCTAPLHYGMPAAKLSELERALKRKRFKMAAIEENNFVLCTCEATNLIFFTKPPLTKGSANKKVQRAEASLSAPETNRTSPPAGSRR